jgi:glycine/D-amino acid oxidase-like deaminating enzyme
MTIIAPNFKPSPYWWEAAPVGEGTVNEPSGNYDVIVIGSGIAGLSAAIGIAEGGRSVLVCDAQGIGYGASTRNNGALVPFMFSKQYELQKKFGTELGGEIAKIAVDAFEHALKLPERYGFDPLIKSYDRFFLATSEKARQKLAESARLQVASGVDLGWQPISKRELSERTGLTHYEGGVYVPKQLAMHPGLFTQGMASACARAGVDLLANCRVTKIERKAGHFICRTEKGDVGAQKVVIATGGYVKNEFRIVRKRIMSARLYMATTEPLPASLLKTIFPTPRQFVDSKINMTWIRPTPDGTRVMVGGRGGMMGNDPEKHAQKLYEDMVQMIPELAGAKFTHCWYGEIDFTYDFLPHMAEEDGIHYAVGYCGIGMTTGSYMGSMIANKILGHPTKIATDSLKFPSEPLPWIGRPYARVGMEYMNVLDRLGF